MIKKTSLLNRLVSIVDPYFGVDPKSEVAGRLRAHQMGAIAKTVPLMMLANSICATLIFFAFRNYPVGWFLPYWTVAVYLLSMLAIFNNFSRKPGVIKTASKRAYAKAAKSAGALSLLWSIMTIALYPKISVEYQVLVVAVVCGMMGGGAMSLYFIPRALFAWVGTMGVACVLALYLHGSFASHILMGMLAVYSVSLMRAGYTMAKTFILSTTTSFELSDQSETIGLLLKDFAESTSDWLWEMNETGQVTRGSDGFKTALGVDLKSISSGDCIVNLSGKHDQIINMRSVDNLRNYCDKQESFRDVTISSSGLDGVKWITLSGKPLYNEEKQFLGFRGVASDITDKKQAEDRIAYLAHNDALTGLVNRANFSRALEDIIAKSYKDKSWSILYLDLDGFKAVNDNHGHAMGDKLLGEVAASLKNLVSEKDIVARLGGDEFAILSKTAGTVQSVSTLADGLVRELSKPFVIDGITLDISVSIGITLGSSDGNDAHTLLNNADLALYRAKAEGRGTYRLYEHQMDEIVKERRSLEADLKSALKNGELSVSYQPLVSAREAKTVSFEALARWRHPSRGSISPSDFIPIAESIGIIAEIGDWVLNEACREAVTWPMDLCVAVNLSPQQFQSNNIINTVVNALKASGLPASRLELEITEGLFMENTEEVMLSLRELKAMGVSISLDDFGTGYSSLSYLLKFPFNKLKIDRSLINSLDTDPHAKNVLEAITKLASVMNLTVTAEGIETLDQVKVLLKMHCTHFQGFLFGQPLPKEQLPGFFAQQAKAPIDNQISNNSIKLAG